MTYHASTPGTPLLVTGGTGTLGGHVVPLLREAGHDVRVLTRQTRPATGQRRHGLDEPGILELYRLLALAKYDERYVIPTACTGSVPDPGGTGAGCSLDDVRGPGMMPEGAGGGGPGLGEFDPDAFHPPPTAGSGTSSALRGRVNLLNRNGEGRPNGLFPRARGTVRTEPEL
ncbi:NAD-dependent epimerase/dehydratase family protein [Streptomyces sp. E5N91]|uniref:NAD-dependent epimerase/dehydratase family protein n=1 Tax=Streptomyces sp. E5N91 TaxID=1851996 RepID=UPI000EF5DA77|nr:NAD-dependent epimerase/dehydratase family protein [Streptomyces sp. E5N91]